MDEFIPQTGGLEVKEGHEESDLSVRGIVVSAAVFAIAGFLSFFLIKGFLLWVLPWTEAAFFPQPQLTAAQKQLIEQREPQPPAQPAEGERLAPGRADEEIRLQRTFPTPRLQYDDVREMDSFRASEDKWLDSAGKDTAGNVHVPVEDAMKAIVDHGLPAVSGPFAPPTLPTAVPMVPAPQRK